MAPGRIGSGVGCAARAAVGAMVLLVGWLGFGLTGGDYRRLARFTESLPRWNRDADLREVCYDYSRRSHEALQARPWGIAAARLTMVLRSLPWLPQSLAVNPTSQTHYDRFSAGPLMAYLHLCGEQGVEDFIGSIEQLGRAHGLSDEQVRAFLRSFRIDPPPATDDGAVRSVRKLLADTEAHHPFAIRTRIGSLLKPHIALIAGDLGMPSDPLLMSAPQQAEVLDRLDARILATDRELWRTKQVSDFMSGIWAQCYGRVYNKAILWILRIRDICRPLSLALAALVAWRWWRRWNAPRGGANA